MTTPVPTTQAPRVRIVQLDAETLHALAEGDLARARVTSACPLSEYLVGGERRGTWRRRAEQVLATPRDTAWVTGVLIDASTGQPVGGAGFHAAPDSDGMVEVGYGVDPAHRRRGYARAALETLLDRARSEGGVRTVRATISPDNEASQSLILSGYGFVETGEQWDEQDGLEIIYEVPVA